mmetsp:Transcript_46549/g.134096  ORF Transcript_46549/g.134096 Transcript_46549/m.134096 type:complete len:269 (-) Transcript_46549:5-811(-)
MDAPRKSALRHLVLVPAPRRRQLLHVCRECFGRLDGRLAHPVGALAGGKADDSVVARREGGVPGARMRLLLAEHSERARVPARGLPRPAWHMARDRDLHEVLHRSPDAARPMAGPHPRPYVGRVRRGPAGEAVHGDGLLASDIERVSVRGHRQLHPEGARARATQGPRARGHPRIRSVARYVPAAGGRVRALHEGDILCDVQHELARRQAGPPPSSDVAADAVRSPSRSSLPAPSLRIMEGVATGCWPEASTSSKTQLLRKLTEPSAL